MTNLYGPSNDHTALDLVLERPRLTPALRGYQLVFPLKIGAGAGGAEAVFSGFTAALHSRAGDMFVAPMHHVVADYHSVTIETSTIGNQPRMSLYAHLSHEDIEALERERSGGDIGFRVRMMAFSVDPPPPPVLEPLAKLGPQRHRGPGVTHKVDLELLIPQSEWVKILAASGWAEIQLVEFTTSSVGPQVKKHWNEATDALRNGKYAQCVTAARMMLEAEKTARGDAKLLDKVTKISRDHYKMERIAMLRKAMANFANPSVHTDAVCETIEYSRDDAVSTLQIAVALLRMLADNPVEPESDQ